MLNLQKASNHDWNCTQSGDLRVNLSETEADGIWRRELSQNDHQACTTFCFCCFLPYLFPFLFLGWKISLSSLASLLWKGKSHQLLDPSSRESMFTTVMILGSLLSGLAPVLEPSYRLSWLCCFNFALFSRCWVLHLLLVKPGHIFQIMHFPCLSHGRWNLSDWDPLF